MNFFKLAFLKNGYILSFIDKCFKMVINKLVIKRAQVTTVEKNTLILSLPYLGDLSLQPRTKLRESFKGILNCCKLQIVFKSQWELANVFQLKDCLLFNLLSWVVYKYTCGRWNSFYYSETDRHLKVYWEHIGISPLTLRKVKPSRECNSWPSPKLK